MRCDVPPRAMLKLVAHQDERRPKEGVREGRVGIGFEIAVRGRGLRG